MCSVIQDFTTPTIAASIVSWNMVPSVLIIYMPSVEFVGILAHLLYMCSWYFFRYSSAPMAISCDSLHLPSSPQICMNFWQIHNACMQFCFHLFATSFTRHRLWSFIQLAFVGRTSLHACHVHNYILFAAFRILYSTTSSTKPFLIKDTN